MQQKIGTGRHDDMNGYDVAVKAAGVKLDAKEKKQITDNLTDQDMVNYAYTIRDKVRENELVMMQIANNSREQAMLAISPKQLMTQCWEAMRPIRSR